MRSAGGGVHVVQKTEPHFRPDRAPMNVRPTSRVPSPVTSAANNRPQIPLERSPRETRTASSANMLVSPWFTWISGASAAVLGFAAVFWLTSPAPPPPGVAILASATVSDATGL